MSENHENNDQFEGINSDKRETLTKLSKAAWTAPVVATFAMGALNSSTNWAHASNLSSSSNLVAPA